MLLWAQSGRLCYYGHNLEDYATITHNLEDYATMWQLRFFFNKFLDPETPSLMKIC